MTSRSVWDAQATTEREDDDPCRGKGYDYDWGKSNPKTQERSDTEQEEADFMESEDDHEQPMETDIIVKQDQQPQWQQDILNSLEQSILELEERRCQLARRRELRASQHEGNTTWSSSELQVEVISVVHGVLP